MLNVPPVETGAERQVDRDLSDNRDNFGIIISLYKRPMGHIAHLS